MKLPAVNALVAVDNSTPSCLGQKPLPLGADFSISSDTKITTEHSDLVLGHVSVRESNWADRLRAWRTQMGAAPGQRKSGSPIAPLATLDSNQISSAKEVGADRIELYTEPYAATYRDDKAEAVFEQFSLAAKRVQDVGLGVNAGHDLNLENLAKF